MFDRVLNRFLTFEKTLKEWKIIPIMSDSSLHSFWNTTINFQDQTGKPCLLTIIQVDHYSSSGFDFHSSCLLFKRSVFYGGPNVTSKYIFPLLLKKDLSLTKNCRELLSDSYKCRELLLDSYNCVLTVITVTNCFPTVMTASRQLYLFICLNLYLPLV